MKTTLQYAKIQFLRVLRDPVTLIVLFAIPVLLLVLFGAFIGRDSSDVTLKVAVVNSSNEKFAGEFAGQLKKVDVLDVDESIVKLDEAAAKLKEGQVDGIIELPNGFGKVQDGRPTGTVQLSANARDQSSADILMGVMSSVAEGNNAAITGSEAPIQVERSTIEGTATKPVDVLYPMFTAMGIMMVGIFGVGSVIPSDKKTGILRRMRVTPLRSSQFVGGMVLAYIGIVLMVVALMTVIAMGLFKMEMHGDWLSFGALILASSMLMIAIGVLIGGWAKNTTQSDIYGQIIFIASLAFSGLWLPRAMMPEWLRDITAFLPLTPIIEGMERIVVEGVSIVGVGFQLAVIVGWLVFVTLLSIKTFRWE
jgi:ABC-2 type transport system permease protein